MSESLSGRFRISQELHEPDPTHACFLARVLDGGLSDLKTHRWATSEKSLEGIDTTLMRSSGDGGETIVFEDADALVLLSLASGFVYAMAAARDEKATSRAIARLRELLPTPEPTAAQEVPVMFWTYTPQGPMPSMRKISVPEWDEIRDNYTDSTRGGLDAIMRGFRPSHGGQLILWHGEVGTGKTFAPRALAWEWRDWCQIHYIVDPDTFFGEHADYLMTVLTQSGGLGAHVGMMMAAHPGMVSSGVFALGAEEAEFEDDFEDLGDDAPNEVADAFRGRPPHWRLLVMEDTGELLRPDAKAIIGQGLSRFLNVVDGLIGQGLRVLVLVTTNEEIGTLHPAVSRPGRSAANIEFLPLSEQEASAWLERHGLEGASPASSALASLYAQLEGRDPADTRVVGFADRGGGRRVE
jgi:hypothetical protein